MKKAYILFAGILLLAAGCAKEVDNKADVATGKTITITASVDEQATRSQTALDGTTDKYKFTWANDEKISVVPSGVQNVLTFTVVDPTNGTFAYTPRPDDDQTYDSFIMAVSPQASLGEVIVDGESAIYEIRYIGSYFQEESNAIMVAGTPTTGSDGNKHFNFKHVGALVRVSYANVPAEARAMVFSTPDNAITGVYTFETAAGVEAVADDIEALPGEQTAGHEARVVFRDIPTDVQESVDFYLPIPTGQYQHFTVKLVDADDETIDGSEQIFETNSPFIVKRADVVECPVITIEEEVEPIVENFNSSVVTNNYYNSNAQLSLENNRNGFDYSWTPAGKGNLFTNGIKLGGGSDEGSITSGNILSSISAGSTFTVNVYAAVWKDDGGKLVVSYNGDDIEAEPVNDPITYTTYSYSEDDFTLPTSFVFTKTADAEDLTIASSHLRILIDKVEIVLGGTPVPTEKLTVTPDVNNPEIVPVEGAVLNYTVSTTNIDSWDVTSSNSTDFVAEKTANGFKVTVSANEGYATRSATITVTGGTKTKTVTINQAANVNSIDNPYTVAEALSIINGLDDNDETANVYTTGTIVDIESIDTGEYKNASYTISDGESSIYVYRGKYLDNAGFTSQDQIKLGDVVVVYGKLKKYVNNNSVVTPEIALGNYIAKFISKAPYFTVVLNGESEISHAGGTRTLTVNANVAWTATIDNNATLKLSGGTASTSVSGTEGATVTATIPESIEAKTYTITFSTTSTEVQAPAAITIAQTAAPTITGIAVEDYTASYSVSTSTYSFNGKVYALYSDNTRVEIPAADYEIDGTVDLSTVGEYELTVTYLTYSETIIISVTNMDYQASATLASWVFTSESYPANKTNFAATSGVCNESTFYLNGTGSTWNTGGKGYAFTAVTDVTITIKAVKPLKAGSTLTLNMDTFYNKASNAPMTGFSIKARESGGTSSTTGLSVTSWTLSNSSATKTVSYTIQNDVAAGNTVVFILTGTGKAGAGQGYINSINAVYSATE